MIQKSTFVFLTKQSLCRFIGIRESRQLDFWQFVSIFVAIFAHKFSTNLGQIFVEVYKDFIYHFIGKPLMPLKLETFHLI